MLLLTSEFPPQPGGIGKHAHDLSTALTQEGKQITVICDTRSKEGKEEQEFDAKLPFEVQRIPRNTWLPFTYLKRIKTALKQSKSHEVILVSGKFSLWMVYLLKLFRKQQCIAIIHGTEIQLPKPYQRKFTNHCLKKCDGVIAVSNYTASLVAPLALKSLKVIPNGIFPPKSEGLHTLSPNLQLITVGNLTKRKGQYNVIKALPTIKKHFPSLQYHLVGLPTEKEEMEALASRLGVSEQLVFHGRVSEAEKELLLQKASIFMMLSEETETGDTEGFGIAILEANAFGVPAIGSLGCGIEDAIDQGISGFLVSPGDVDGISKSIQDIIQTYPKFSQQAAGWSQKFHWEKVVQQYLAFIHETVSKNS